MTCGDKCPAIIINRLPLAGDKDYIMDIVKIALLVCLLVGITVRNQANRAGIFSVLEEIRKLSQGVEEDSLTVLNPYEIRDMSFDEIVVLDGNDEDRNTTTHVPVLLNEHLIEHSPYTTFAVHLVNSLVTAFVAILAKEKLIDFIETAAGFLVPIFMIIYPCKCSVTRRRDDQDA